jgi:alkylation response protein AidB-like acyl-CoA dehydrogenase
VTAWPTREESELAAAVRRLLDRFADGAAVRRAVASGTGFDPTLWSRLVEQVGLPGLAVAEEAGGSGADVGALAAVAVEVGRRVAPLPWLSSVLAAEVLAAAGADEALTRVLAGTPVAVGLPFEGGPVEELTAADGELTGTLPRVVDAAGAELLVVAARTADGPGLFLVEAGAAGLTIAPLETLDLTRRQARVTFAGTPAAALAVADVGATLAAVDRLATVLLAAEQVGTATWCLDTATEHARTRQQFGVPIGSFQAVKHLCADLLVQLELARSLLEEAVDVLRPGSDQPPAAVGAAVDAAAAACAELGATLTAGTIQVLGGIGFTWENDAHLYFRRARASAQLTGTAGTRRDRLAGALTAPGGARTVGRAPAAPDVAAFAERAAAWLAEHAPRSSELRTGGAEHASGHVVRARDFQRRLAEAGLAGITWPVEYGGLGLGPDHELAFAEAARGRETYTDVFAIGLGMCGPVLLALGSEEQKRHLPAMLRGAELWCQLFSEPSSGSDLASLRTRAERQDDGSWVVTGQKVWTTYAHESDYGLLLARTDPAAPKHRGITMFVVDMHAPGITARPLRQMTGDSEFNEVFLDGVRLPADAVVGEVGGGWQAAMVMLMNERVTLGRDPLAMSSPVDFARVLGLVRERGLAGDPVVRQRLADLWLLQRGLELLGNRIAEGVRAGEDPGPYASVGKLGAAILATRTVALAADLVGPASAAWEPDDPEGGLWAYGQLFSPALSIAGGTDQIQRSIIGERLLGLPR